MEEVLDMEEATDMDMEGDTAEDSNLDWPIMHLFISSLLGGYFCFI